MSGLLRLFADIALLRRGPEDLPASLATLTASAAGYFAVNFLAAQMLPPIQGPWLAHLVIDIAFTLIWYWALLRLFRKPERYLQTASAIFGYQTIIAPLSIWSGWLVGQFQHDPAGKIPVWLLFVAIAVWTLTVNVRILRSALESPVGACVLLVVLQTMASLLLLIAFFPPAPGVAPG